ncbi:MAG: recombinase family protein [Planctomycetota bacterium]
MPKPHQPTVVVGYARVSTIEQAETGISLDAQRHRLRAYCDAHALTLARVETDAGLSAKRTSNRPALLRALLSLKRGEATGIVVMKLDRLSRTTRDILDLIAKAERERWAVHSISEQLDTSSAQGRFVVTLLGALSQLEREQAAERTKTAMAELRRQGKRISGKPPFGYRFEDGRVVEVAEEQVILGRIRELRDAGKACYAIASALNREGVLNPRTGREWFFGTIRSVMETAAAR